MYSSDLSTTTPVWEKFMLKEDTDNDYGSPFYVGFATNIANEKDSDTYVLSGQDHFDARYLILQDINDGKILKALKVTSEAIIWKNTVSFIKNASS